MCIIEVSRRVCVIGAGPSGLTTLRACKDIDGIELVCYDKQKSVTGTQCFLLLRFLVFVFAVQIRINTHFFVDCTVP